MGEDMDEAGEVKAVAERESAEPHSVAKAEAKAETEATAETAQHHEAHPDKKKSRQHKFTRITRLEMKGFKSFANKTDMEFGEHFNCILGPNGSGKSNVMDALCFVLGKSSVKGLRAEKSLNLIYNGGKMKNPAHDAEVSLYLDNSQGLFPYPEKEVKITRIIRDKTDRKRKGKKAEDAQTEAPDATLDSSQALAGPESSSIDPSALLSISPEEAGDSLQQKAPETATQGIYKINGKTKTRQQILELLSLAHINPDGYNIILQGDIIQLIEMPSIERRGIVEEIAGIHIYEDKKERAIRELQKVEEKLSEAEIILVERKAYLNELRKERDQALKFRDLDTKIKQNKATMIWNRMEAKKKSIQGIADKAGKLQGSVDSIREKIGKLRIEAEKKREEIAKLNAEVEKRGQKDELLLHKELEKLRVEQAVRDARIQTIHSELGKLAGRRTELEQSKKDIQDRISRSRQEKESIRERIKKSEEEVGRLDTQIRQFRERHSMDNIQGLDIELVKIDQDADELQQELSKMREEQQNLLREKDKIELMLQSIEEKLGKVEAAEKENKEQVMKLKGNQETFKKLTLDLSKALSEDSSLAAQLQTARSRLSAKREELSKLEARNITVRETVAGGIAIQKILALNKEGVHGLVSSLGTAPSEYQVALEVAAGNRIKGVVVDNDRIAEECISYLKDKKLGVATFLPLNKLRTPQERTDRKELLKEEGVKGFAVDLLQYDSKFSKAFSYVFENTLVVESIAVARKIGIGKVRMVTLQGDLVEASGAMQGGFRQKSQGLGFAEKEVTDGIAQAQKDIADYESMMQKLEQKRIDQDELIVRLRQRKAELEGDMILLEKSLHLDSADLDLTKSQKKSAEKDLKELDKKLEASQETISEKTRQLAQMKVKKQELREKVTTLRSPAVLAELNVFEDKRKSIEAQVVELKAEERNLEGQINSIFTPEIENIDRIFKQQQREKEQFDKEFKGLEEMRGRKAAELEEKEKSEAAFYAQFQSIFAKRNSLSDEVTKIEHDALSHEEKARGVEQDMNLHSLENAKTKAELAGLEEEYRQYEGVELYTDKSEEQIQKEVWQFEKMQSDIGAVNMKALEVYEKVEQEFGSIVDKKKKLFQEREDILILINEIDSRKIELFMKTFKVVDRNFQKIFQALSTKGEAFLELESPEDPFMGGLTIKVRISGTKFLDIRSLSGGEKTMTALAFLFAVQEHEPASFYVLDEVDAALDKRNSEKLSLLVKDYAKKAQYVMISHNDTIISEAENLYGISMNEHGISKVTSLKI